MEVLIDARRVVCSFRRQACEVKGGEARVGLKKKKKLTRLRSSHAFQIAWRQERIEQQRRFARRHKAESESSAFLRSSVEEKRLCAYVSFCATPPTPSQSSGPRRGCGGRRPMGREAPSAGNFPLSAAVQTERRCAVSCYGRRRSIHSTRTAPTSAKR